MKHYLRTSEKRNIIECETGPLYLAINCQVWNYSSMLLNLSEANRSYARNFARDIERLSNIKLKDVEPDKTIDSIVESNFKEVASIWGLDYINESIYSVS